MELKAHEQTYDGFIRFLKISTAISAVVTALVILAIAN